MSEVTIYGAPASNYVRSVRIACHEKGVPYALEIEGHNSLETLSSPEHLALHPFARIPAFRHGDRLIYETAGIIRYVDEAFDGPALQPEDVYERAVMTQWMSAALDYINACFIRGLVLQYIFPRGENGEPDRSVIDVEAERAKRYAQILEDRLAESEFLAGDRLSLADIMVMPMLINAWNRAPEAKAALEPHENIARLYQTLVSRPSFAETAPELQSAA